MHVLKIAVCDDEESSVSLSETYTRQCLEACSAPGRLRVMRAVKTCSAILRKMDSIMI